MKMYGVPWPHPSIPDTWVFHDGTLTITGPGEFDWAFAYHRPLRMPPGADLRAYGADGSLAVVGGRAAGRRRRGAAP